MGDKTGKGSKRRPSRISREREDLNWALVQGKITFREYGKKRTKLIKEGKWHV